MSEILNAWYDNPQALTQSKHYHLLDRQSMSSYRWDCYPIMDEYYHEFNPFFVHTIPEKLSVIFPAFKVFTVRDGYIAFADFLLKYWRQIPGWKNYFLIPESYAPLIPENLHDQFFIYKTSQLRTPDIKKAKSVTIFGLLNDYYFGDYKTIEKRLAPIRETAPDTKIELAISIRRNPFLSAERENSHWIEIPELIRKCVGERPVSFVKLSPYLERSVMKDSYLIDLAIDEALTCDSFFTYWYLGRGGMVDQYPVYKHSDKALFELDVSFGQKLQVFPFPKIASQFPELLFFQKLNKGELLNFVAFHRKVKSIIS